MTTDDIEIVVIDGTWPLPPDSMTVSSGLRLAGAMLMTWG